MPRPPRRFRAVPGAPSASGFAIGVTLQPAPGRPAPGALQVAENPCKSPARMRWRYFPGLMPALDAVLDEDTGLDWSYDLDPFVPAFNLPQGMVTPGEIDQPPDIGEAAIEYYDAFGESEITITLLEDFGFIPQFFGSFVIDFVDAQGAPINLRNNYEAGCTDSQGRPAIVQWQVAFVQDEVSPDPETRTPPQPYVTADWQLVVPVVAGHGYIPGVLTISALDEFSAGGPYTLGPLAITYVGVAS